MLKWFRGGKLEPNKTTEKKAWDPFQLIPFYDFYIALDDSKSSKFSRSFYSLFTLTKFKISKFLLIDVRGNVMGIEVTSWINFYA
jgi:hypothetical protein